MPSLSLVNQLRSFRSLLLGVFLSPWFLNQSQAQVLVKETSPAAGAIQTYTRAIARADSLYWAGHYLAAAQQYEATLQHPAVKPLAWDWYEAARLQVLSKQYTKALSSLQHLLTYAPSSRWRSEPDFVPLQQFAQWQQLTQQAEAQQAAAAQRIRNRPLADSLARLLQEDQATRQQRGMLTAAQARQFFRQDSLHLVQLRRWVARYGWLGRDQVGRTGNEALFLALLHSDKADVLREFLPAVERSVHQGQTDALSLAYLHDRLAVREGRPQLYGTQFQQNAQTQQLETAPLAAPDQVDIRRYRLGLPPLATYVRLSTRERPAVR